MNTDQARYQEQPLDDRKVEICIAALEKGGGVLAWDDEERHWIMKRQFVDWIRKKLREQG